MKPENKQILDKIVILNGAGAIQEKVNKSDFNSYLEYNAKQIGDINDTTLPLELKGKCLTEQTKQIFQNLNNFTNSKQIKKMVITNTVPTVATAEEDTLYFVYE
ncbi:hypothetical protein [Clostridium scatologenes]|uniref:Uncharacterized protein n=1 Tax=Clostridium scatologenes TaxID=1548 RepID=A0A0E3M706_CLOSL|nr:hypothetical protein [Clostridium scatologenes]AKA69822.1 hypothetical protein CSCA_2697 [Clostridium scatologenes]